MAHNKNKPNQRVIDALTRAAGTPLNDEPADAAAKAVELLENRFLLEFDASFILSLLVSDEFDLEMERAIRLLNEARPEFRARLAQKRYGEALVALEATNNILTEIAAVGVVDDKGDLTKALQDIRQAVMEFRAEIDTHHTAANITVLTQRLATIAANNIWPIHHDVVTNLITILQSRAISPYIDMMNVAFNTGDLPIAIIYYNAILTIDPNYTDVITQGRINSFREAQVAAWVAAHPETPALTPA